METGHKVNQYVFIEKLGDGGMGEVWRGRHSYLDYDVAIKFLKPQFAHDRDLQERFLNEGKRQARLDHPNIVRAIDFATEAGRNYLIMKFVEGQGLDRRIEEAGGPLPTKDAFEISYQVLSALGHAHRAGVVHRDVKPSNILIDHDGKCYLTDFGIALATGQARVTRTGTVIGTTHYMSPEQIRRPHAVDGRTDVYSFGVVLFEMLTGRPPFDAEGDNEFLIKQAHVQEEPPKPSKLNHLVTKPVETVILCALAKQPDDRWSTCEEMAEALSLAAIGKRPVPRRTQPARTDAVTPVPSPPERFTPPPRTDRRPRNSPVPLPQPSVDLEPESIPKETRFAGNKARVTKLAVAALFLALAGVGTMRVINTSKTDPPVPSELTLKPGEDAGRSGPRARTPEADPSASLPKRPPEVAVAKPLEPAPSRPTDSGRTRVPESAARPGEVASNVPSSGSTPSGSVAAANRPVDIPVGNLPNSGIAKPGYTETGTPEASLPAQPAEVKPTEAAQVNLPRRVGDQPAKPRIEIFRPDPPAATVPPPEASIPAAGTLQWSVELRKNEVESLSGSQLSSGRLISGQELPGVPVAVSIQPLGVAGVVEAPSPSNGWKALKIRGLRDARVVISIQWKRL